MDASCSAPLRRNFTLASHWSCFWHPFPTLCDRKRSSSLSNKPYKYTPKNDGPIATASSGQNPGRPGTGNSSRRRQSSKFSSGVIPGDLRSEAAAVAAPTGRVVSPHGTPPPQRGRKDSLLLKPTPEAIARVKAAVERRKKLQAAAASASAGDPAKASALG